MSGDVPSFNLLAAILGLLGMANGTRTGPDIIQRAFDSDK